LSALLSASLLAPVALGQSSDHFVFILSSQEASQPYAHSKVDTHELVSMYKRLLYYRPFIQPGLEIGPHLEPLLPYRELDLPSLMVRTWLSPGGMVDEQFANTLAISAGVVGRKINRQGRCLSGVVLALDATTGSTNNFYNLPVDLGASQEPKIYTAGGSANEFLRWANENPIALCDALKLSPTQEMRKGFIAVYGKGRCGFSAEFGHIEVISEANVGCSDHCRTMKSSCQPDLVLAPMKDCSGVHYDKVFSYAASLVPRDI
jgi:hypothetical protein